MAEVPDGSVVDSTAGVVDALVDDEPGSPPAGGDAAASRLPAIPHPELRREDEVDESGRRLSAPALHRFNTTSTMVVDSTMARPLHDATVAAVAHRLCLLNGVVEERLRAEAAEMDRVEALGDAAGAAGGEVPDLPAPPAAADADAAAEAVAALTLETSRAERRRVAERRYQLQRNASLGPALVDHGPAYKLNEGNLILYIDYVFQRAELTEECLLISLIYIERLLLNGGPLLSTRTWKVCIVVALLLASKVWDDVSMVNADFAIISAYPLEQLNAWEVSFLEILGYNVSVPASEYAKRYFELRDEFAAKHGIAATDGEPLMHPLNVEQAQRLEAMSTTAEARLHAAEGAAGAQTITRSVSLGAQVMHHGLVVLD